MKTRKCKTCGVIFEQYQDISGRSPTECEECKLMTDENADDIDLDLRGLGGRSSDSYDFE